MTDIMPNMLPNMRSGAVDPPLPESETPLMANPVLSRTRPQGHGQPHIGWYVGIPAALIILAGGAYLLAANAQQNNSLTAVPPSTQPVAAATPAPAPAPVAAATPAPTPAAAPVEAQAAPVSEHRVTATADRRERLARNDRELRTSRTASDTSDVVAAAAAPVQSAAPPPPVVTVTPAEPPVITPPPS
jgi:hypothetical protein